MTSLRRSDYGLVFLIILLISFFTFIGISEAQADAESNPPTVAYGEYDAGMVDVVGLHRFDPEGRNFYLCGPEDRVGTCPGYGVDRPERLYVVFKCANGELHSAEAPDSLAFDALEYGGQVRVIYRAGLYGNMHHTHEITRVQMPPDSVRQNRIGGE